MRTPRRIASSPSSFTVNRPDRCATARGIPIRQRDDRPQRARRSPRAKDAGLHRDLAKPVKIDELTRALETLLENQR